MRTIKRDGYEIILSDRITELSDCVLALGNFDGVHIAHSALLDSARKLKENISATQVGVWCFGQSPIEFFSDVPSQSILSRDEKISLFFESGMDFVAVGDFSKFRNIEAEDFIKKHLIGELSCVGAVCGYNFRFGQGRAGDPSLLKNIFGNDRCVVVNKIQLDGITVSSTKIREFILDGNMESARAFLGRPFYINTSVTEGKRLGRALGFPTANQTFPAGCIIPKRGIYATVCTTEDGKKHIGVSNVGIRPTITDGSDSHAVNCETYIIDFNSNIYGQNLKVEFFKLLRNEKKFSSVDELKQAIDNDSKAAAAFFETAEVAL